MLPDIKNYPHKVRIPWKNGEDPNRWSEVCVTAVEEYGFPGGKYTTHPTTDYMDFYFKDEVDAIWFRLKVE